MNSDDFMKKAKLFTEKAEKHLSRQRNAPTEPEQPAHKPTSITGFLAGERTSLLIERSAKGNDFYPKLTLAQTELVWMGDRCQLVAANDDFMEMFWVYVIARRKKAESVEYYGHIHGDEQLSIIFWAKHIHAIKSMPSPYNNWGGWPLPE